MVCICSACSLFRVDTYEGGWLVFLDESNNVKLGDFGLSKALNQASFANTYVGVRRRAVPLALLYPRRVCF